MLQAKNHTLGMTERLNCNYHVTDPKGKYLHDSIAPIRIFLH